MTESEFTTFIQDICNYYERKLPKDSTADLWFSRIKGIPIEPLPWIFAKLTENEMPKNLPGAVWALYKEWLLSHSEKALYPTMFECPDCKDDPGYLHVTKVSERGAKYTYVFNCGLCRQAPAKGYPYYNKADLLKAGFEILNLLRGPNYLPRNVPALVNNVIKIVK